jgi:protein-tyrosine phosphatase
MDVSAITDQIYVGSLPGTADTEALRALDPALVINMLGAPPPASVQALDVPVVTLSTWDNLLIPIPIERLERGVRAALPVLRDGGRVLIYCRLGRHRSVAMAVCILIALGSSSAEAAQRVRSKRRQADPRAWHIWRRILSFERHWAAQGAP